MKIWAKLMLAAASAALLLSGCAGPRYADVASKIPTLDPQHGRIYFYQLASAAGAAATEPAIMVDGRKVGRSKPARFFFVDRPAGTVALAFADRAGPNEALSVPLAAGQTRYVRVDIEGGQQVLRQEASEEAARQAMGDLKYWGAGWRDREKLRY